MRLVLFALLAIVASLALYVAADFTRLAAWIIDTQRGFQNEMAGAVQALRAGEAGAIAALLLAAGAYGFVHALGPGHGKYLVGGLGLGTRVSTAKLLGIAAASSVAQALWAIILVYGGFALVEVSAAQLTFLAEDVLAPLSYAAISAVGLLLVWRGLRVLAAESRPAPVLATGHGHAHDHECGCGHSHGPTQEEVAQVGTWREALALIGSIAIRPCTGAIFLLVIAWQMDIVMAGAFAVLFMGLGTAALTGLVAVSSVAARGLTFASAQSAGAARLLFPAAQIFAGSLVLWISIGLLLLAL